MSPEERQLLTGLFDRVRGAANTPRDQEAEALIQDATKAQPYAPYFLAQTVLVQDQALRAANDRLQELEGKVKDLGGTVNPLNLPGSPPPGFVFMGMGRWATMVQFEIGITATEGTGTKGGIGVVVGAFALGSSGQSQRENSAVNRVTFAVPVILPVER